MLSQRLSFNSRGSYDLQSLDFCNHRDRKLEEANGVAMALSVPCESSTRWAIAIVEEKYQNP